ncbi:Transcriptional adapter ada2, partial [Rhizophlyctis rosea]
MGIQKKPRKNEDAEQEEGTTYDFGDHYHCDLCDKDVTHTLRIRCAHESCKEVDICISCFSTGAEKNNHRNDHPYRVIDILNFPVFEENWRADEEIYLIEGLEQCGPGNWEEIAEHVSTKNKQECADHYQRIFIDSPDWPIPDMTKNFDPSIRLPIRPMQRLPKVPRPPSSTPVNSEIVGFMPGRQEFETEYENEAEQHVKDMEFTDMDTEEDRNLKTAMLSVYNTILERRKERKDLVFDRGLAVDFKKLRNNDGKRSKEEQKLLTKLRVFARLQTSEDFATLAAEMMKEMTLRKRIADLQEYRRMGITTRFEASDYEREKQTRINRAIKEERGSARYRPYD